MFRGKLKRGRGVVQDVRYRRGPFRELYRMPLGEKEGAGFAALLSFRPRRCKASSKNALKITDFLIEKTVKNDFESR